VLTLIAQAFNYARKHTTGLPVRRTSISSLHLGTLVPRQKAKTWSSYPPSIERFVLYQQRKSVHHTHKKDFLVVVPTRSRRQKPTKTIPRNIVIQKSIIIYFFCNGMY